MGSEFEGPRGIGGIGTGIRAGGGLGIMGLRVLG